jgi:tight adherence protein B
VPSFGSLNSPLLPWVGIGLLVVGLTVAGYFGFSGAGPLVTAWRNYVNWLERRRRTLFLTFVPAQVPFLQIAGVLASIALGHYYDVRIYGGVLVSVVAPHVSFWWLARQRVRQIEEQTVPWLVMLVNSLKVTGSLADAFRQTLELIRGPLGQELDLMMKEMQMGLALPDAVRGLGERVRSEVFSTVLTVIMIGRSTGGELPNVLTGTAAALRERFRLEGVLRKHTANARMQLIALLAAPAVIYKMFQVVEKNYFLPFSTSGIIGYAMVGVIFLAWAIAAQMGRKILKVDV